MFLDLPPLFFILLIIAFFFGSFSNVLIHRIPHNISIISPASHCPECKYQLQWYENVPVISFIMLQGKCSNCSQAIPWHYPVVEILVSSLSIPFIFKARSIPEYIFFLTLISVSVALALIDHKNHELPHALTYTCTVLALAYIAIYGPIFYKPFIMFYDIPLGITRLASLFTALIYYGLTLFILDSFTHLANIIYFRKSGDGLRVVPSALTLRNKFLEQHITWLYIVVSIALCWLFYQNMIEPIFWFGLYLGISYLINEIFIDFMAQSSEGTEEDSKQQTVFGGGDTAMIAFIAVVLGLVKAFIVLLVTFYLALIYLIIRYLLQRFKKEKNKNFSKYIPLGGTLALSFIAAMMIL